MAGRSDPGPPAGGAGGGGPTHRHHRAKSLGKVPGAASAKEGDVSRRIALVVAVLMLASMAAVTGAEAQPRTNPPTLDLTCHGYDEGVTRAYNCIPVPAQQHLMRTFVPPVGSPCDRGQVIATPDRPDRIVFQVRCQDSSPSADVTIRNVTRYDSGIDFADWLEFEIVSHRNLPHFTLEVRLHYHDGTFLRCNEYVDASVAGDVQDGLVIPDICGSDVQWTDASILAPPGLSCSGCGRWTWRGIEKTKSISPEAPNDALELERVMEEYRLRFQPR